MALLGNHTFNVAVMNDTQFKIDRLNDGSLVGRSGPYFLFLELLSFLLGFKYHLVFPKTGTFGIDTGNGTYNGMIGMLQRKEAAFSTFLFFVSPQRLKAFSSSPIFYQDDIVLITKKVASHRVESCKFFFEPFETRLWILIITLFCSYFLISESVRWLFPKLKPFLEPFSSWNVISRQIGLETHCVIPSRSWLKVAIATLTIIVGCFFELYNSTLSYSVGAKPEGANLNTIKDFVHAVRNGTVSMGLLRQTSILEEQMQHSDNADVVYLGKILEKNKKNNRKNSILEAARAIKSSNFAFIIRKQYFFKLLHDQEDSSVKQLVVHIPKEKISSVYLAMAYARSFQFIEIFNQGITKIFEGGFLQKILLYHNFKLERANRISEQPEEIVYIGYNDLKQIFNGLILILTCVGIFLIARKLYSNIRVTKTTRLL